jgi:uncharacterized membrane protein YhhN
LKYTAIIFFVVVTFIDLYLISNKQEKRRYLTKPLIIPAIIFIYLLFAHQYNKFLLLALLFSFFGDLLLLFSEEKLFFRLGLFAFLSSHIFYIYTFIENIPFNRISFFWIPLALIPYCIYAWKILQYLGPYVSHYFIPVILYIVTIIGMSYASLFRFWTSQGIPFWFPFIGSLFFIISDTLLATRNFRYGQKKGWVSVMATYVLAQLFIMIGFIH